MFTQLVTMSSQWWSPNLQDLASQLPPGALNEMRRRILHTNIQREKLALDEDTARMRSFFQREIKRHQNKLKSQRRRLCGPELDQLRQENAKLKEDVAKLHATLRQSIALMQAVKKKYLS